MKKKLLCNLSLALALSMTMLTGCVKPSESLSKALNNSTNINACQTTASMTFKIDGNEQAKMMNLSEFGFTAKSKVVSEKNKKASTSSDISIKYGGMSIDTSLFMESIFEKSKMNTKMIVSIPPIFLDMLNGVGQGNLPSINANAQYFVIDSKELEKSMGTEINAEQSKKAAEQMEGLSKSLEKAIDKYVTTVGKESVMKEGKKEISYNGSKVKATVYEVKITDKQFKSFVRGYINNIENDKDLQKFIEAFTSKQEKQVNFKDMVSEFNKEFDQLPQIIGDKGLNLTLAVKDNYVIQETVDTEILLSDFSKDSASTSSLGKLSFKYTTDIFNINGKDIKVELPKVNSTNSINLADLIKNQK